MIAIENYRGTVDDLAEFVNTVWETDYGGKMPYPRVTPEYFDWQFRLSTDNPSNNLLAAYDGSTLAGVLLGTDYPFRSPEGMHPGSVWSWLSVSQQYRGRKLVKELDAERVRRQREIGSKLIVSYRYVGSRHSLTERPRQSTDAEKFHRKVGLWARVLDPKHFSDWHISRATRVLTKLTGWMLPTPKWKQSRTTIRDFQPADLDACVDLVNQSMTATVLAIHWDHDSLRHQLAGSPITETLVAESDGKILGLVNFHVLPFQARTVENVGCIDVIAFGAMPTFSRARLLNAALARMCERGAILAVKLRCGDTPALPMMQCRFLAMPADSYLVLQPVDKPLPIDRNARLHLLWR